MGPLPRVLPPLLERIKTRITGFLRRKPRRFWLWLAAIIIVAEITLFFLYRVIVILPDELKQVAIYYGQRITVDLSSGDILGGSRASGLGGSLPRLKPGSGNAKALNNASYEPLTQSTPAGPLPKIASDSLMPWTYYAKPYMPDTDHPKIAILLTELGMSPGDIEVALQLPPQITFSLSPYASHVAEIAERLRSVGFETMIDIPMQAENYPYSDSGPYTVLADSREDANLKRLHHALSRFSGYTGGVAGANEIVTSSLAQMPLLVKEFTSRGIMLVYVQREGNLHWRELPFSNAWMAMPADLLLDAQLEEKAIRKTLDQLVATAKQQYSAVGVLRPYPVSLKILRQWLETLNKEPVELVPLSVIAHQKYRIFALRDEKEEEEIKKSKKPVAIDPVQAALEKESKRGRGRYR